MATQDEKARSLRVAALALAEAGTALKAAAELLHLAADSREEATTDLGEKIRRLRLEVEATANRNPATKVGRVTPLATHTIDLTD